MDRQLLRRGFLVWVALALAGSGGCKNLFAPPTMPDDPLFLERKPLEAKAQIKPPVATSFAEPVPPPNPYFANGVAQKRGRAPATLTSQPRPDKQP